MFSVYAKKSDDSEVKDLVFLCNKFAYSAFFTGPLLLFTNGLWRYAAVYIMMFVILLQALYSGTPDGIFGYWIGIFVLNSYVAASFSSWIRDKLLQRGYTEFSMALGCSELEAKAAFYRENPSILQKYKEAPDPDEAKQAQKKTAKYW